MRLVCPNCDAKYEVPDDAIPDTGRDVQCANCGHAWFQMRARSAATAPVAAPVSAPAAAVAEPVPEPEPEAELTLTPVAEPDPVVAAKVEPDTVDAPAEAAPEPEPVAEALASETAEPGADPAEADPEDADPEDTDPEDVGPETAAPDTAPDTAPEPEAVLAAEQATSAYGVDDSVLAILREEAERETNARRAEARALETQTDLGLDALPAASAPDAEPEPEAKPAPRRDLLPDVEEINSTLRPSDTGGDDAADAYAVPLAAQRNAGFRSGFLTVMAVAVLAAAAYLAAPQIGGLVPALQGPLDAYVGQIDSLRLALDGMMRSATVAINGS